MFKASDEKAFCCAKYVDFSQQEFVTGSPTVLGIGDYSLFIEHYVLAMFY
jgi:hypothetical protein